jgi:outer membrane immunogenic protein
MGIIMRKVLGVLLAFAAMPVASGYAADMAVKAPPAAAAAIYNWTGFYIGGEVGGGWARGATTDVVPSGGFPAGFTSQPINYSGVLGGGYAGYNYQVNQIVLGIDGNYDGAGLTGSGSDISPTTGNTSVHSAKMKWDAAITGRLGYANNNVLFFVKGGWAWAGFSESSTSTTPGGALFGNSNSSDTRNGGTVGGGIEYGFAPHWSAKLEYAYVKFRTANYNATAVSAGGVASSPAKSSASDLNEFKGGVAYRF